MGTGAINNYIDVAQLVLYAFWIFFFGLIYYLRREDKREGYPMESDWTERSPRMVAQGFPDIPSPKTFYLRDGSTASAPHSRGEGREIRAQPVEGWPGAPLVPTGNPMVDGVGPASYAMRRDIPDTTDDDRPKLVPLRVDSTFSVESHDPDPRGMPVIAADRKVAGTVRDLWVDRSEMVFRYLEVQTNGGRTVLLPMNYAQVSPRNQTVTVVSILASQFEDVPTLRNPDTVTFLEEDRIVGYFAGGYLYATPARQEPLL
jgi:photosynthetic reaction center H subunit